MYQEVLSIITLSRRAFMHFDLNNGKIDDRLVKRVHAHNKIAIVYHNQFYFLLI